MMRPEETIVLEHDVRSKRLRRLVAEQQIHPAPDFHEYIVPAALMPSSWRHDTPVLRVVFPESTFFRTGESAIVPDALPIIQAMAQMLQGDVPDVAAFVAGHADNRGSEPYNFALSMRRANAVATALRQAGADAPDIWSVGFGESLPLYENSDDLNMSFNRRVEFLFAAQPEAAAVWLKDQMDLACGGSGDLARARCLSSLKIRSSYVVESVARQTILKPVQRTGQVVKAPTRAAPVQAKPRQIVINLAERSYVVRKPEM